MTQKSPEKVPESVPVEEEAINVPDALENECDDFIDDDFGLSIKKEWENLKLQQQKIEEEVKKNLFLSPWQQKTTN